MKGITVEMKFYSSARPDGLALRYDSPRKTTCHFLDREDRLEYRSVTYETPETDATLRRESIFKMTEKYTFSPDVPPHQNIAKKTYFLKEDRVQNFLL